MHAIGVAPRMLVVLGLLAAIGVAGCSDFSTSHPVAAVLNQPVSAGTAAPSSQPTATATAAPSSRAIQNLLVSAAVRSELVAAFAALNNWPLSYVNGTEPGSVYYAYDPATDTYWAMAHIQPSATGLREEPAGWQDGGNVGLFKKVGSGPWKAGVAGIPVECGLLRFFPRGVLAAWSLPTTSPAGVC